MCEVGYPSDAAIEWQCYKLRPKETPESLFGDRWVDVLRFNRVDRRHLYSGVSLKVPVDVEEVKNFNPMPEYYPDAASEKKFILLDLSEQFLGAYEFGQLVFSMPVATGEEGHRTPVGKFRITAYHRWHRSSLYEIENTNIPYPMFYALRFYISRNWVQYWIHGRDMPGYPASHGCIGLYDEPMQERFYRNPKEPVLHDSKKLFEWAISPLVDGGGFHLLKDGPMILITGSPPL